MKGVEKLRWACWAEKIVGARTLRHIDECEELPTPSTDKIQNTRWGRCTR